MQKADSRIDSTTEKAVRDIFKSKAEARIYLFLLRHQGARSEEIIKGTKLHPSTVRELLSKMYSQHRIYRKKLKNESIGKNPYLYHAVPPLHLLQSYVDQIEYQLTKIANLAVSGKGHQRIVKIIIREQGGGS